MGYFGCFPPLFSLGGGAAALSGRLVKRHCHGAKFTEGSAPQPCGLGGPPADNFSRPGEGLCAGLPVARGKRMAFEWPKRSTKVRGTNTVLRVRGVGGCGFGGVGGCRPKFPKQSVEALLRAWAALWAQKRNSAPASGRRGDPPQAPMGLGEAGGHASHTTSLATTHRPQRPGEGHPAKRVRHRYSDQGTHPSHYPHSPAQGSKGTATTFTCSLPTFSLWPSPMRGPDLTYPDLEAGPTKSHWHPLRWWDGLRTGVAWQEQLLSFLLNITQRQTL